jgi:hypothetical protein
MITAREVSYGLFGAWRLAHLDPRGMEYFDTSVEGFWRSFWAAALMAPFFAILVMLQLSQREVDWDPFRVLLVETIGYTIAWTAFPLAAFSLLAALGKQQRYLAFIVAYNWSNLIQIGVMLPVAVLEATDALPGAITGFLFVATFAAILFYQYFIARVALEVDISIAVGLVFIDLMLGVLRQGIVNALEFRIGYS